MNQVDLMSPEKIAAEYGGNKQKIAQAVQMGVLNPTVAVMAGMFIDRMRNAATQEQAPQTTVAQDIMAPTAPRAAAQGGAGLDTLPVDESMVPGEESFAGGGIVAFDRGGDVNNPYRRYTGTADPRSNVWQFTPEEIEEQKRLKEEGLMGTLRFLKGRIADPVVEYFSRDHAFDPGSPRARERETDIGFGLGKFTPTYTAKDIAGASDVNIPVPPAATQEPGSVGQRSQDNAPSQTPKQEATEDYITRLMNERKAALAAAGVSDNPYAADREAVAGMRAGLDKDRDQAKALALMEAGFGIAGGKSRYALQNVGEGAKGAVGSYAKAMRDIGADEKEYAKIDRDLSRAEDALKRGEVDKAFELREKAENRAIKLREVAATEKTAGRAAPEVQLIERYAADKKIPFSQAYREIVGMKAEPKSRDLARKEWAENPIIKREYPDFEDYYRAVSGGSSTSGWGELRVK